MCVARAPESTARVSGRADGASAGRLRGDVRRRDGRAGQADRERRSAPGRAVDLDRTAELLDELAHDVEAETGAAVRALVGAVDLPEHLEDVREVLGRNADASVAHGEDRRVGAQLAADDDLAAGSELEGVADEVLQDHLQLPPIGVEDRVADRLPL